MTGGGMFLSCGSSLYPSLSLGKYTLIWSLFVLNTTAVYAKETLKHYYEQECCNAFRVNERHDLVIKNL